MREILRSLGSKPIFAVVLFCLTMLGTGQFVSAQSVTFAQMLQFPAGQDFIFTNNGQTVTNIKSSGFGAGASATFSTIPGGTPVLFFYQNIDGLNPALQGGQNAVLTVTSSTTTPAALAGSTLNQPLDGITTVQITRNTPAPDGVGNGTRTNLLTAVFQQNSSPPLISGNNGGNSATLSSTTPNQIVTFTSDFITFAGTTARNLGLSFSSVNPPLMLGINNFLANFSAAGTGTFASNPAPVPVPPPSAATAIISGRVLDPGGRGVPYAIVEINDLNGTTQRVRANNFGYYRFEEVIVGNTYIFNAASKGHIFSSEVLSVFEDVFNLNIVAIQ